MNGYKSATPIARLTLFIAKKGQPSVSDALEVVGGVSWGSKSMRKDSAPDRSADGRTSMPKWPALPDNPCGHRQTLRGRPVADRRREPEYRKNDTPLPGGNGQEGSGKARVQSATAASIEQNAKAPGSKIASGAGKGGAAPRLTIAGRQIGIARSFPEKIATAVPVPPFPADHWQKAAPQAPVA
jgi:hypothetical protein